MHKKNCSKKYLSVGKISKLIKKYKITNFNYTYIKIIKINNHN